MMLGDFLLLLFHFGFKYFTLADLRLKLLYVAYEIVKNTPRYFK